MNIGFKIIEFFNTIAFGTHAVGECTCIELEKKPTFSYAFDMYTNTNNSNIKNSNNRRKKCYLDVTNYCLK